MREVFLPRSLEDFWPTLESNPRASVYAGGTDLLVKIRSGLLNPPSLICLERIEELKGVTEEGEVLRIGGLTTHARLLSDPLIEKYLPVLRKALKVLGSPLIRNLGTIGGNICTASPAGDTLPPLYALRAELELRSRNAVRRMPIEDFITGPGLNGLHEKELLAAIWVKKDEAYNLHHFEKVGQRNALACSLVSLAALLRLSPEGIVEKAALAWGSVGPTIVTSPGAEEKLIGRTLSGERLREAAAVARDAVSPITDERADAGYRRAVAGNLLLRLIQTAAEAGG